MFPISNVKILNLFLSNDKYLYFIIKKNDNKRKKAKNLID